MSPLFVTFERFGQIMARLCPTKCHERLPAVPDGTEQTTKPATAHLVQQMPNHVYRQREPRPASPFPPRREAED